VREYEVWFLQDLANLQATASDYEWIEDFVCESPEGRRDAKGLIDAAMKQTYKETVDQLKLTRRLGLTTLYKADRSFRRFVKAISGLGYEDLDVLLA
jgi:hypothetical protein